MWEEILRLAVGNGLWAVLFCALLFHLLRDSKRREEKYTHTIETLVSRLKTIADIKEDTEKLLKRSRGKKTSAEAEVRGILVESVKKEAV